MSEAAKALKEKLETVDKGLVSAKTSQGTNDRNVPARVAEKLAALATVPASSDHAPTKQSYKVFEHLSALADTQIGRLQELVDADRGRIREAGRRPRNPSYQVAGTDTEHTVRRRGGTPLNRDQLKDLIQGTPVPIPTAFDDDYR